jgi:hypothetical protein
LRASFGSDRHVLVPPRHSKWRMPTLKCQKSGGGGVSKRENNLFEKDMMSSLKRMRKHEPLRNL